jgi:excisionase family DNA binding protein
MKILESCLEVVRPPHAARGCADPANFLAVMSRHLHVFLPASYRTKSNRRKELTRQRGATLFWHAVRHRESRNPPSPFTNHQERLRAMFEQQLGRSVTIDQAAELLRVSRRTIYNRIRDGKLLTIRTIGGSQRVLVSSVDENRRPIWGGMKVESVRASEPASHQSEPFGLRRNTTDS